MFQTKDNTDSSLPKVKNLKVTRTVENENGKHMLVNVNVTTLFSEEWRNVDEKAKTEWGVKASGIQLAEAASDRGRQYLRGLFLKELAGITEVDRCTNVNRNFRRKILHSLP